MAFGSEKNVWQPFHWEYNSMVEYDDPPIGGIMQWYDGPPIGV